MQIKKKSAFVFIFALYTNCSFLSAQHYGYPYDAYNLPYEPVGTMHDAPYYRPGALYNQPRYPNPYYPPVAPVARPFRMQPSPYPASYENQVPDNHDQAQSDSNPTQSKIDQIINVWFGPLTSPLQFPAGRIELWEGSVGGDRLLKENFSEDYQRALLGQYGSWRGTPDGRLALVILLDQFSRHIYPDQPQMFAADAMARGLVLEGIQLEDDQKMFPVERAFFYMPLQHSEDPQMQAISVNLYQQLVAQSPASIQPIMQEFLRLAIKHQEVINRFGRFPHRNKVLGRTSTPEEMVYLGHKSAFRY